jgi:hypothetical protein
MAQAGSGPASRIAHLAPGFATLTRYDRRWLAKDVLSGISVAAIALPVGLAYADLAGVPGSSASTRRSFRCSPMRCSARRGS